MRKREIIKALRETQNRIDKIVNGFDQLGSDDRRIKRNAQNTITFTFFELMDGIGEVEVATYNYLKRKGWT